jgi:hypothetical protein
VREVDVNDLTWITEEGGRIRALIMNMTRSLIGTDAAHLVAGAIEHIYCSLDRIEEQGCSPLERRRPHRAEYSNPHFVPLLRQPTGTRSASDDRTTKQGGQLETTVPSHTRNP